MHNAKEAKNGLLKLKNEEEDWNLQTILLTTLLIERFTNCLLDSLMITIWLKRKHQKHLNCCSRLHHNAYGCFFQQKRRQKIDISHYKVVIQLTTLDGIKVKVK